MNKNYLFQTFFHGSNDGTIFTHDAPCFSTNTTSPIYKFTSRYFSFLPYLIYSYAVELKADENACKRLIVVRRNRKRHHKLEHTETDYNPRDLFLINTSSHSSYNRGTTY